VAVGDLNGDGKLDLAVANIGSSTVSVLLNQGPGTFAAKDDFGTGMGPNSVALGDLDGDGLLDLAVSTSSNTVSVILAQCL
jgi:DNA-binding beta-propeller fold protein YncE